MKTLTIKKTFLLTLIACTFSACIKHDKVSSMETIETLKKQETQVSIDSEYGIHTNEIEAFLSATPLGSEIYLEQKESGEWYLKIEKTFTAKKDEEESKMIEPTYGESILI